MLGKKWPPAAVDELAAQMSATKIPTEHQRTVQAVLPHLRGWNQGWEQPESEPREYNGSRS